MALIFLNRFFHPDHSATSQMLSDLAFDLAARGEAVAVIASRLRYDAAAAALPPREIVNGVAVSRVWTSRFGRAGLAGRAVDYLTFYVSAAWQLWRTARRGDVVVAKTDPPMLSVMAGPVCRLRGARLVNWHQDIFPETAQALGLGAGGAAPAFAALRWLRDRSVRGARQNVVLGEGMAARVAAMGVPAGRIAIVPNWADGALIHPVAPSANPLRRDWDLEAAFVVGYSGNLGRAHEVETLLEAMERLGSPAGGTCAVRFLFVGGGAHHAGLKAEVARRGLSCARFQPYQPRARLAQSLSVPDVHLVSLRPELEGLIVPSKFYGIAAAGRPTVFIGAPDGEIARLLARHACGLTVAAGDGAALAAAISRLALQPDLCLKMGAAARTAFDARFDRRIALARWHDLLARAARE
ncbi:glycosyltransferase family 4 protein [Aquabacter spiritensis]|uniref:Glycosyltransferase involved in cell wall biosynthesis n=1 Tax=Aquabacter spiritensis TaxID=933073 RepID=A0A4R3LV95_9HYPH|nr:glycosyltransferase family 4 protein [Aquabacter spiritensis]TCT03966.1 glycosyltransferase involved in cell wall biosynthesis [Aquabacter spiritensis]